ncbi:hypothetical protein PAHAL_7G088800 [Panicum hallii]|uniref:Uncharacterized protein n=1 Tax=Panicum hallii TaxID=206008 RepID=A0A2T8IBM6_9POAL|nr:hypothetical protein PAHAL_7G088800 [Panicum hallii]
MDAASQAVPHRALWFRTNGAMMQEWQWGRLRWGRPVVLLQQPHMEHIVDAGAGRKLQPNGDLVDEFDDAVRPEETRLQLAAHRLRER